MENRELLAKVKQLKCMCNLAKTSDYTTAVMVVDALAEFYSLHAIRLLDVIETHLEEEESCISAKSADTAFLYPVEYEDRHGADFPPYESSMLCPKCLSPGFSKAVQCSNPDCKKLFPLGDRTNKPEMLCAECRKEEENG